MFGFYELLVIDPDDLENPKFYFNLNNNDFVDIIAPAQGRGKFTIYDEYEETRTEDEAKDKMLEILTRKIHENQRVMNKLQRENNIFRSAIF